MNTNNHQYLNEKQVSSLTGIALPTLRNWRFECRGIPYIKVGHGRSVRYLLQDVIDYMESGRIQFGDQSG